MATRPPTSSRCAEFQTRTFAIFIQSAADRQKGTLIHVVGAPASRSSPSRITLQPKLNSFIQCMNMAQTLPQDAM